MSTPTPGEALSPDQLSTHAALMSRATTLDDLHAALSHVDPGYRALTLTWERSPDSQHGVSVTDAVLTTASGEVSSLLRAEPLRSLRMPLEKALDDLGAHLSSEANGLGPSPLRLLRRRIEHPDSLPSLSRHPGGPALTQGEVEDLSFRHTRQHLARQLLTLMDHQHPGADAVTLRVGVDNRTRAPQYETVTHHLNGQTHTQDAGAVKLPDITLTALIFDLEGQQTWRFTRHDLQVRTDETLPLPVIAAQRKTTTPPMSSQALEAHAAEAPTNAERNER